jgi:acetyl-CoA carboxylase biotin carboxylase subunit
VTPRLEFTILPGTMFRKVLIANRGEIAVRIAQTLQEMGITAVAVYSDPDRDALHVAAADEAHSLPGNTSAETYLRGDRIIEIARRCGANAVHPGYGFLSENAEFSGNCRDAGITFIGPAPEAIRAMGDKIIAKQTALGAGVPVVPGWSGTAGDDLRGAADEARRIGYPVLVKAAAGGGGKGMRRVFEEKDLAPAIEAARREAAAAFGDSRVFIEKYIENPRHIEIQIFGDNHGHVVHLFERECSIQRRHQKIIEESPSPAVSERLRAEMGAAAVRLARTIGYANAGTVEFILDPSGEFYFLEVNTRLQVEHPVTELITRQDLVAAQVRVAAGEPLPFTQEDLRSAGHALECRIYAEDASRGFVPSVGEIIVYHPPEGREIRVDSGVSTGSKVSVYYDPMLAKLIVHAGRRDESIRRMIWALEHFVVLGVTTNIEFLRAVLQHPEFVAGRLHTHFLEQHKIAAECASVDADVFLAAAAFQRSCVNGSARTGWAGSTPSRGARTPWAAAGPWRIA